MAVLYVKVPRDLSQVKSKFLFNLTKRQLLCFSIAALIGFPVFFFLKGIGNPTLATLGMMVVMLPLFLLAMYERNSQPLEVILKQYIQAAYIRPKIRPYQTSNVFLSIQEMADAQREVKEIVDRKEDFGEKRTGGKNPGETHKSRKKENTGNKSTGNQKK